MAWSTRIPGPEGSDHEEMVPGEGMKHAVEMRHDSTLRCRKSSVLVTEIVVTGLGPKREDKRGGAVVNIDRIDPGVALTLEQQSILGARSHPQRISLSGVDRSRYRGRLRAQHKDNDHGEDQYSRDGKS